MNLDALKCPGCKAILTYGKEKKVYACSYCKYETNTLEFSFVNNQELMTIECNNCNKRIIVHHKKYRAICPYCHNNVFSKKETKLNVAPEYILPFKIDFLTARTKYIKFIKKFPLAPSECTNATVVRNLTPVYVPYLLAKSEMSITSKYEGEKIRQWDNSLNHFEEVSQYKKEKEGIVNYSNLTNACIDLDLEKVFSFPQDYKKYELNDVYDSIILNKDDENLFSLISENQQANLSYAKSELYPSDLVNAKEISSKYSINKEEYSYVLLPAYLLNLKFNNKDYTYLLNAYTEKESGYFPISKLKIGIIIGIVYLIFLVVLIGVIICA